VLNDYAGACCVKYKRERPEPIAEKPELEPNGNELPAALDRAMISEGVAHIRKRIESCGDKTTARGTVAAQVVVSPDGHVAHVQVDTAPDPALGNCVAGAMAKAQFTPTQSGGRFTYPFVF
jgi:TonB family protein